MEQLRAKDYLILQELSIYPQGLSLEKVHEYAFNNAGSIQSTHQRLRKLMAKGLVRKEFHIYKINDSGARLWDEQKHLKDSKPIAEVSISQAASAKAQRFHAITAVAKLFPTSYSRIESTLKALKLPYRKTGITPAQYILVWEGIKLRISTKKITLWGREINAPITINQQDMANQSLSELLQALESFLNKTNIRVQKDMAGVPLLRLKYWEIAFIDSEIARKATEKNSYIPLAFDRKTGKWTIWADNSDTPEFETNKLEDHKELRRWAQAVEDGAIHPYQDTIDMKRSLAQIIEIQKTNTYQLQEYARQIELHLKLMKKIDTKLNQRRLFDN